jgi:hypothetical protein
MDQCSRHDIPPAISVDLADRPGHALDIGLDALLTKVLTGQRLGDSITSVGSAVEPH